MDGPKMSVSRIPVRWPRRAKERARFTAMVDLPTPPLADETAMILRTEGRGRLVGRPRWARGSWGGALEPERGRPWDEFVRFCGLMVGWADYQGILMTVEAS